MNYLIISNYYRLTNDQIAKLINPEAEYIRFDLNVNSFDEIVEEAKYNSLFSSKKNIVVYNCDFFSNAKLSEQEELALIDLLNKPNPDNIVIFISQENEDNRKKITKILKEKKSIFNYLKIDYRELTNLVSNYVKEKKYNINSDLLNYIIKASNNNYDIICNELDKLNLCFGDNMNAEEAKILVSTSISDNIYKLLDEVMVKNQKGIIKELNSLKIFKIDPSLIMTMLGKEFRNSLFYKIALENNVPISIVFKNDHLQDWQIRKIANNSRNYSKAELINAINLLSEYDYKYKSGKINRDLAISMFMIDLLN